MASDFNRVIIEGRLGEDAQRFDGKNGKRGTIVFNIASNKSYKVNDEWQEQVTWVGISYYRSDSEKLTAALSKGTRVRIEGSLQSYKKDTSDGKRTILSVKADTIEFLPALAKRGDSDEGEQRQARTPSRAPQREAPARGRKAEPEYDDDSIPDEDFDWGRNQ